MFLYESIQSRVLPNSRRESSKEASRPRSAHSTPSASPSREPSPPRSIEQAFNLTTSGHNSPWLTLRVRSNASPSKAHPLYFDRDTVEGAVDLNLADNPTNIIGVVVFVRGQVFSIGADQSPFLELSQTLWSSSTGHPKDTGTSRPPFTGRLSGSYSWPFSIPLPSHVTMAGTAGQQTPVPLPPTFAQKGLSSFIDYKIQVLIKRGSLRVDTTLTTSFVYLPRARAPRPPRLLESAYLKHHPVLSPALDPDGWETLPSRTVTGVLFGVRDASVECTLSISHSVWSTFDRRDVGSKDASHRIYARDCPIHLHITLRSGDAQLLDLLSAGALKAQLVQQVRMQPTGPINHPHTVHSIYKSDKEADHEDVVVVGTCWRSSPGSGISQSQFQRHFDADILVRKDLKPSFSFPTISLQYIVELSLSATGFTGAQNRVVYSEPVTIVTDKPRGSVPRPRTPVHL